MSSIQEFRENGIIIPAATYAAGEIIFKAEVGIEATYGAKILQMWLSYADGVGRSTIIQLTTTKASDLPSVGQSFAVRPDLFSPLPAYAFTDYDFNYAHQYNIEDYVARATRRLTVVGIAGAEITVSVDTACYFGVYIEVY